MDEQMHITRSHLLWDLFVFLMVIISLTGMFIEVFYDLEPDVEAFLFYVDAFTILVFVADIWILWSNFNGPFKSFLFRNWLDFLAAIPIFRIIRIARFARLLKLARLRRLNKLKRIKEVKAEIE